MNMVYNAYTPYGIYEYKSGMTLHYITLHYITLHYITKGCVISNIIIFPESYICEARQ